jgi:hypothetical protein
MDAGESEVVIGGVDGLRVVVEGIDGLVAEEACTEGEDARAAAGVEERTRALLGFEVVEELQAGFGGAVVAGAEAHAGIKRENDVAGLWFDVFPLV